MPIDSHPNEPQLTSVNDLRDKEMTQRNSARRRAAPIRRDDFVDSQTVDIEGYVSPPEPDDSDEYCDKASDEEYWLFYN